MLLLLMLLLLGYYNDMYRHSVTQTHDKVKYYHRLTHGLSYVSGVKLHPRLSRCSNTRRTPTSFGLEYVKDAIVLTAAVVRRWTNIRLLSKQTVFYIAVLRVQSTVHALCDTPLYGCSVITRDVYAAIIVSAGVLGIPPCF